MRAEVGDEQHGDDPTIHELCDRMAALLGKQAAVFLPSGTMCNQIADPDPLPRRRRDPGARDCRTSSPTRAAAPGALTGAVVLGLNGERGQFDPATMRAALREQRRNAPPQTLWRWSRPPMPAAVRSGRWTS